MINNIKVFPIRDGGNPRTEFDIRREEKGFFIRPFCEDGDGTYRFRLKVGVSNNLNESVPVLFNIEWGDTEHQDVRKHLVLSSRKDQWEKFEAKINGTKAYATIEVPPGNSYLSYHPSYGYERFNELVDNLPKDRINVKVIGKSRHNRDILVFETGRKDLRPLAVITRVHPHETVGSYLFEGMIKWLTSDDEKVKDILSKKQIVFIPMPNPDGVAEGNCRRTAGGFDFSNSNAVVTKEPEGVAVKQYYLKKKPIAHFDLHGWLYDYDVIITNNNRRGHYLGRGLHTKLKSNKKLFNKGLSMLYHEYPTLGYTGGDNSLGGYLIKQFNLIYYDAQWPWYGRNADDLREMGVHILKCYTELF